MSQNIHFGSNKLSLVFADIRGHSRGVRGLSRTFADIRGHSRTVADIREHSRTFADIRGRVGRGTFADNRGQSRNT